MSAKLFALLLRTGDLETQCGEEDGEAHSMSTIFHELMKCRNTVAGEEHSMSSLFQTYMQRE
jgi:hypothetical protein